MQIKGRMATMKTLRPRPPIEAEIPVLKDGDRLTREEFERRYEAMPHVNKAELIEGVVYMPSPVGFQNHAEPQGGLVWLMKHYSIFTPGVKHADNGTVRLDSTTEPQPDGLLFITF